MSRSLECEESAAAPTRLHNSGWGGPPEQYRTPGIGTGWVINLPRLVNNWSRYDVSRPLMPQIVESLADGCSAAPALQSHQAAQLRDIASERGWLAGIILTCNDASIAAINHSNAQTQRPVTERDIALAALAVACSHPPVIIWDATPSWNQRLRNTSLEIRWLRRTLATPLAHEAWSAVARASGANL